MPKGWLNKIILIVITAFTGLTILVAGLYIGYTIVMDNLNTQLNSNNEDLKIRAEKLAKFSRIPPGYTVTKALDMAGVKIVIANYPYNGQVMAVLDPAWVLDIKENITMSQLEEKIKTFILNFDKQDTIKIEKFWVERFDSFKALNQSIPYMKVSFSLSGKYSGDYKGIIGIIKNTSTNKNILIISYNSPQEYRQYIAERFFQKVEF